jgi:hypothetical protein
VSEYERLRWRERERDRERERERERERARERERESQKERESTYIYRARERSFLALRRPRRKKTPPLLPDQYHVQVHPLLHQSMYAALLIL